MVEDSLARKLTPETTSESRVFLQLLCDYHFRQTLQHYRSRRSYDEVCRYRQYAISKSDKNYRHPGK